MELRKFLLPIILLEALLAVPVSAHSPIIAGGNDSIERALIIEDPAKSWAVFSNLPEGRAAQFYRLEMREGDRIYFTLQISPESKKSGFSPFVALIGPGFQNVMDKIPFEISEGLGIVVMGGTPGDYAYYEGFTPAVLYKVVSYSSLIPATGAYYLAVFGDGPGSYSLAIGYNEEFTPYEWTMIPINQILIYLWSGQSPIAVLTPLFLVVAFGSIFLLWRWRPAGLTPLPRVFTAVASLLYIGTGATILNQVCYAYQWVELGPEVGITLVFAGLPVFLGIAAIRKARNWQPSTRNRFFIFLLGALGVLLWAGYLIGPLIMMIASILPGIRKSVIRIK